MHTLYIDAAGGVDEPPGKLGHIRPRQVHVFGYLREF